MQSLDAVQDVGITLFLLRIHALAKKLATGCVQHNAFNLGAAEVYADAKHVFKSSAKAPNDSSAQRQPNFPYLINRRGREK
jgi:hypothetical protein